MHCLEFTHAAVAPTADRIGQVEAKCACQRNSGCWHVRCSAADASLFGGRRQPQNRTNRVVECAEAVSHSTAVAAYMRMYSVAQAHCVRVVHCSAIGVIYIPY